MKLKPTETTGVESSALHRPCLRACHSCRGQQIRQELPSATVAAFPSHFCQLLSIHIGHFPCCDIPATLPSGGASVPVKESPELRRFQRWYHLAGIRLEVVISFCVWPCHVPVTFVIRVGGRGLARNKLDLVVRVAGVAIGQQLQRKNISKHDVTMETLDAVCDTIKHHQAPSKVPK